MHSKIKTKESDVLSHLRRSHERVLAGEDDDEGDDPRLDGVGLVQEGWQKVWDRIVYQEGLRSKIKLGVDITKIERRGLGDYA